MKVIIHLCIVIAFLLSSTVSFAKPSKQRVLFWYPGEAGSTTDAQPLLNIFTEYLESKLPEYTFEARYYNTLGTGITYIKRQLPVIGFLSYPIWYRYKGKIPGAQRWMSVITPVGGIKEKYVLVGNSTQINKNALIYSSDPLPKSFFTEKLFPNWEKPFALYQTSQILSQLKAISGGKKNTFALLTPTEAATLKRLKGTWVKKLVISQKSKSIPPAQIILFEPQFSGKTKLQKVLLEMIQDENAAEMLAELRIKQIIP